MPANSVTGASVIAHPSGRKIIAGLKAARVREVVALPDIVTCEGLLKPISRDPDFRLTPVCKEDEGVSICGAMSYNGTRAVLLMQQTGLMDSLNAVRAIAVDYERPVVMLVGLQGKEPHLLPENSLSYGVRIIPRILDAMELRHSLIEGPGDEDAITDLIEAAYARSRPHVFLIGRSPVMP